MYKKIIKRLIDIVVSFTAICVLLPVYIIVGVIVFADLGFPVIFKQKRPGKDNRLFTIYKFRTMKNEYDGERRLSHSERITKTGRLLRRTYFDEIPEFFCVLSGRMSLIGPRPQLVEDMVFYSKETMVRQSVLPGITGLAQSKGADALGWDEKFKYDIQYAKNITFKNDMKIVFDTFRMLLSKKNSFDSSDDEGNYGDMLLKNGRISQERYEELLKYAKTLY